MYLQLIEEIDKMMTTAGSLALAGHFASKDAFIVKKINDNNKSIFQIS